MRGSTTAACGWHPAPAEELETLLVGYFDDARSASKPGPTPWPRHYDIKLPPQPVGYCTWYSKPYGGAADEKHLAELAEFSAKQPGALRLLGRADRRQVASRRRRRTGPIAYFTSHRPDGPYPHGMKAAAEQSRRSG